MDTNIEHASSRRVTWALTIITGTTIGFFAAPLWITPTASAAVRHAALDDKKLAVFSDLTFDAALAANTTAKDRVLIVKATAVWCGPCKMMNKTTWIADDVIAWVKTNGTAIELDVDEDQKSSIALQIKAMPTMVAFKNGKELDRVVGYKSPAELLEWFAALERGETSTTKLVKKIARADEMGMQERMSLARDLMQAGKLELATEQYAWLWENMVKREPAMFGVRGSFLASEIQSLVAEHEPAKAKFTSIRDALQPELQSNNQSQRDDWLVLNSILEDDTSTLQWIDAVKASPQGLESLERYSFRITMILEAEERWADIGKLTKNPLQALDQQHDIRKYTRTANVPGSNKELDDMRRESSENYYRESIARLYGCLLAAGRNDDAKAYADKAAELDPTANGWTALVQWALKVGEPRESHRGVLDAAAEAGGDVTALREELETALKKK